MIGLTICGANCLLSADYKSAGKIIARTGQAKPGKGDVIVTTRSGGVGTSTVQFKSVMAVPGRLIKKICTLLSGLFAADFIIYEKLHSKKNHNNYDL